MSEITLSPGQAKAVDEIMCWVRDPESQVFVLGGYAGTGKTTVMKWIVEQAGLQVHCCAPTGKAVSVLKEKLPEGSSVSTIHSFVYQPVEVTLHQVEHAEGIAEDLKKLAKKDPALKDEAITAIYRAQELARILEAGSAEFIEKEWCEEGPVPLVVVDESSMCDEEMEALILRNAGKVLFVGDPGQLPPVNGKNIFERRRANAVLEQIHRQAAESRILRFATAVRHGERFDDWSGECEKVRGRPPLRDVVAVDQVITGKNATRRGLNQAIRRHLGFTATYPQEGERLMCLRNDHGRGLINGVGGVTTSATEEGTLGELFVNLAYNGRIMEKLMIDPFHFDAYADPSISRRDRPVREAQFDFGNVITCHKSQGSEWPHVIVWDDKMRVHDRESRKRWAYTAITRAAERLTWVDA